MEIEIDKNYNNSKRFKNFIRLPFVIYSLPTIKGDKKNVGEDKYYSELNENEIIEFVPSKKEANKQGFYIYGAVAIFIGIFIPLLFSIGEDTLPSIFFYVLTIGIGIFFAKTAYNFWIKFENGSARLYMKLDRLNSLLILPKIVESEYLNIYFKDLRATIGAYGTKMNYSGKKLFFYRDYSSNIIKRHDATIIKGGFPNDPKNDWSFYVWYMDKNRPLPPGSAFNEFREKDFQRRKAEGFPPPLFKSLIPTPEATAEQQLIREAFWKDEDYMATKEEAKYSLNPFKK